MSHGQDTNMDVRGGRRREEKQKPIEYSEVLSYIISMRNTEFFPVLINTVETRRPL